MACECYLPPWARVKGQIRTLPGHAATRARRPRHACHRHHSAPVRTHIPPHAADTPGGLTKRQRPRGAAILLGPSMSRPISNVPLELSEVMVGHVRLVARPGMRFPVRQLDGQLTVTVPELGLHVIARDRRALAESVELAVAKAWRDARLACLDDEADECSATPAGPARTLVPRVLDAARRTLLSRPAFRAAPTCSSPCATTPSRLLATSPHASLDLAPHALNADLRRSWLHAVRLTWSAPDSRSTCGGMMSRPEVAWPDADDSALDARGSGPVRRVALASPRRLSRPPRSLPRLRLRRRRRSPRSSR